MPLANYAQLQAAIAREVARVDLTEHIKDWIYLCEQSLNLILQRREMEQRATTSTIANVESYPLPTNFGTGKALHVNGSEIRELGASDFDRVKIQHPTPGPPRVWSMTQNEFLLGPTPDGVYQLELYYYKTVPNLSDSNIEQWVLTKYPSVMLYGALAQGSAGKHIDTTQGQKWVMAYKESLGILIKDEIAEGSMGGGPFLQTFLPFGVGHRANILTDTP